MRMDNPTDRKDAEELRRCLACAAKLRCGSHSSSSARELSVADASDSFTG